MCACLLNPADSGNIPSGMSAQIKINAFFKRQANVFTAQERKTPGGHSQDLMHAWQRKSLSPLLLPLNSVKKLLTDALNKNQYLKRLELQQIKDMVECMYERTYQQGEYVIKQGEPGNHLFVLAGRSSRVWSPRFRLGKNANVARLQTDVKNSLALKF